MGDHVSLPPSWVDRIFLTMATHYGTLFLDRWKGTDLGAVKAAWAEKLGGFRDMPEAIKVALDSLGDHPLPPTLPEFLQMCRDGGRRVAGSRQALPPPPMTQEERDRAAVAMQKAAGVLRGKGYRDWAYELRNRYLSGERLLAIQVSMASEALGEVWENGQCRPGSDADGGGQ